MKKLFVVLALCAMFVVPASHAIDVYAHTPDLTGYIQYDLYAAGRIGDNIELTGSVVGAAGYSAVLFYNPGWSSVVLAGLEDDAYYGHTLTGYTYYCTYISHSDMVPEGGWTVDTTPPGAGAVQMDLHKVAE